MQVRQRSRIHSRAGNQNLMPLINQCCTRPSRFHCLLNVHAITVRMPNPREKPCLCIIIICLRHAEHDCGRILYNLSVRHCGHAMCPFRTVWSNLRTPRKACGPCPWVCEACPATRLSWFGQRPWHANVFMGLMQQHKGLRTLLNSQIGMSVGENASSASSNITRVHMPAY